MVATLATVAGIVASVGCSSPGAPTRAEAIFQVRACRGSRTAPDGQVFRILLRDSSVISQARALVGAGGRRIVLGRLAQGNGGFNTPWNWHLDPDTVSFPQVAIELCDGCPSDVEASGVSYGAGTFCPWTSEIIAEQN